MAMAAHGMSVLPHSAHGDYQFIGANHLFIVLALFNGQSACQLILSITVFSPQ